VLIHSALPRPGSVLMIRSWPIGCHTTLKLPALPLGKLWRERITRVLAASDGLILDLRSSGYVESGLAPTAK
jgi:hypothetical protein